MQPQKSCPRCGNFSDSDELCPDCQEHASAEKRQAFADSVKKTLTIQSVIVGLFWSLAFLMMAESTWRTILFSAAIVMAWPGLLLSGIVAETVLPSKVFYFAVIPLPSLLAECFTVYALYILPNRIIIFTLSLFTVLWSAVGIAIIYFIL